MDWNNVNLDSPYERDQHLISSVSFDTFLLEIECNERVIDRESLTRHFEQRLDMLVGEAKEVFNANLGNLVNNAQKRRKMNECER